MLTLLRAQNLLLALDTTRFMDDLLRRTMENHAESTSHLGLPCNNVKSVNESVIVKLRLHTCIIHNPLGISCVNNINRTLGTCSFSHTLFIQPPCWIKSVPFRAPLFQYHGIYRLLNDGFFFLRQWAVHPGSLYSPYFTLVS